MGKSKEVTIEYDIVDADGNTTDANGKPYGTRKYSGTVDENGEPHGGSLFVNAYNNRKNNVTNQVYMDPDDPEDWTAKEDAEVTIGYETDGKTANITINGPEWYAEQVKNSDWFKDNYDNNTFRSFMQAYINNPNGTYVDPNDDTKTITYQEAWDKFAQAFGEASTAYRQIAKLKDTVEGLYGVQLNDKQAIIAATSYDKNDYDKNAVVYVPKWMADKHDFSQYGSWNADDRTLSAEDFFKNYYSTANWDKNGIRELKDNLTRELRTKALYGGANSGERDLKTQLKEESYKDDIARTMSIAQIVSANDPESDFAMDVVMFTSSVFVGFGQALSDAITGLGSAVTDILKFPSVLTKGFAMDVMGMDEESAEAFTFVANLPTAVTYTGLSAIGELLDSGAKGDVQDWANGLTKDLEGLYSLTGDNAWHDFKKQVDDGFQHFWDGAGTLSQSVEAGRFIGGVIYKIVEQVVMINKIGGLIQSAVSGLAPAASSAATATSIGLANGIPGAEAAIETSAASLVSGMQANAMGAVTVNGLASAFKALLVSGGPQGTALVREFVKGGAWAANQLTQGVIESLVDDADSFHSLATTGDTEFFGILWKNVGYNAFADRLGWGVQAAGKTIPGKAVSTALRKTMGGASVVRYKTLHWLSERVHGANPKNAKAGAKMAYLEEQARLSAKAAKAPVLKGVTEEGATAITKNYEAMQDILTRKAGLENAYDNMVAGLKQGTVRVENDIIDMGKGNAETIDAYYKNAESAYATDSELIKKGVLAKSKDPANRFSVEASNYMSYQSQRIKIVNSMKQAAAKGNVTEYNAYFDDLAIIDAKLASLSGKLGGEYTVQLDALRSSIAKYQYQLNLYKLENGLFTDTQAEEYQLGLMKSGLWGEDGSEYMHTERYIEDENYAEIAKKRRLSQSQRSAHANKHLGKDIDADFVDPTTLLMEDMQRVASLKIQGEWQDALLKANGLTKNVVATKAEKLLADHYSDMRKANRHSFSIGDKEQTDLDKSLHEAFDQNDIFAKTYKRAEVRKKLVKSAENKIKTATERNKQILGLHKKSVQNDMLNKFTEDDMSVLNSGLKRGQKIPEYDLTGVKAADFEDWLESLSESQRNIIKRVASAYGTHKVNITNVRNMLNNVPGMKTLLQRDYIRLHPEIMETETYQDLLFYRRMEELTARQKTIFFNNVQKIKESEDLLALNKEGANAITGEYGVAFTSGIVNTTEDVIEAMSKAVTSNQSSTEIVKRLVEAGVDEGTAVRYVTLHNLKSITKSDIKRSLSKSNFASKQLQGTNPNIRAKSVEKHLDNAADALYKNIQSEYNSILNDLNNGAFGNVIDPNEIYGRVEEYVKDIGAKVSSHNVVAYADVANNTIKYIEVDPLTADLYNLRPGAFTMTMDDYGAGAQHVINFFNKINRVFQWGTTGFSLTSFANQWWRDSFNAVVVGGARPFLDFGIGMRAADGFLGRKPAGVFTKTYVKRYGKQIAADVQANMDTDQWESFVKAAQDKGQSIEEAAVEYSVRTTGFAQLPGQDMLTTAGYYQGGDVSAKFQSRMNSTRSGMIDRANAKATRLFRDGVEQQEKLIDKALRGISEHQLGSWREMTLRQNVYTSAYARALDAGLCPSEAKIWATRFALDSTTDFARPLVIGDSIAKSVPYFGAAINGMESFYRLLELDPMGIAGRFIGGLALPTYTAIGKTLSDEGDRKIYANIPEYEKEDKLIFVHHGQVIGIPLPQEISAFVAPWRQAAEIMHDANDHSWLDLISADLLAIAPVDLSGFVDLDYNELLGDPSFMDRIARGTEKAASNLMPSAAKAVYKIISGRDPYTGRSIDTSYTYVDDEGNVQVMDTTQSAFAQWLSSVFGGELSPSAANSIFKDLIGRANMNLADAITTAVSKKNIGEGALVLAKQASEGVMGVVSPKVYNQGRNEWRSATLALEKEKAAIQGNKDYQSILQKIAFETDPEKLRALYGNAGEYVYQYQMKVCDVVNKLKEKYPGMYNKTRQAAVISLLNMNNYATGSESAYARSLSKEIYYQGKMSAISTMQALGFTSTEDNSILGYGKYVNGEYKFIYNDPLAILNMGNVVYGQSNINKANLESILAVNGLKRGDMYGDIWKSLKTKAEQKAYKAAWNKKVLEAIAPYVQQHGVDQVLADFETRDFLDNILFIDNPYKTKDILYKLFGGGQ